MLTKTFIYKTTFKNTEILKALEPDDIIEKSKNKDVPLCSVYGEKNTKIIVSSGTP